MEKNKRYSYDAGYKLKVRQQHMQKNMETEQLNGISALHQQKKIIRDCWASKEKLKKFMTFTDFKGQFGFIN